MPLDMSHDKYSLLPGVYVEDCIRDRSLTVKRQPRLPGYGLDTVSWRRWTTTRYLLHPDSLVSFGHREISDTS